MKQLRVHNPCNEHTRYFRYYNLFWDKLTEELKKNYSVEENRYYEFANSTGFQISLQKGTYTPFTLHECEYVIEDLDTGEFYILSVSDDLSVAILGEKTNPFLKKVLVSQFIPQKIYNHTREFYHKYSPWIYFPSNFLNLELYYHKRKHITDFKDKFYFRGTSLEDRSILQHFNPDLFEGGRPLPPEHYYEDLIKYKVGLSIAGRGELCYRDIEYMALGIPFMRFEYQTKLLPNLIPNYHYIAIPLPEDMPRVHDIPVDRLGTEEHAAILEKLFLSVKDDEKHLAFIAKNARHYYQTYLTLERSVSHTLELLNL